MKCVRGTGLSRDALRSRVNHVCQMCSSAASVSSKVLDAAWPLTPVLSFSTVGTHAACISSVTRSHPPCPCLCCLAMSCAWLRCVVSCGSLYVFSVTSFHLHSVRHTGCFRNISPQTWAPWWASTRGSFVLRCSVMTICKQRLHLLVFSALFRLVSQCSLFHLLRWLVWACSTERLRCASAFSQLAIALEAYSLEEACISCCNYSSTWLAIDWLTSGIRHSRKHFLFVPDEPLNMSHRPSITAVPDETLRSAVLKDIWAVVLGNQGSLEGCSTRGSSPGSEGGQGKSSDVRRLLCSCCTTHCCTAPSPQAEANRGSRSRSEVRRITWSRSIS